MSLTWLEGLVHKHTIICIVAAGAILLGFYKWTAHADQVAHDQVVLAEHQLQVDQQAQKAADAQAQKDSQAYQALKQQMDSQNAALRSQITALGLALASRQAQDRALPPSELATRWEGLVGLVPGSVSPAADGYKVTLPAGTATVVMLEEIPAARQTIANQGQIIANDKQELAAVQTALNSAQSAGEACKVTLKSQQTACEAEKKEIVAKNRKHNLFFSVISFIAGAILGHRI